MPFGFAGWPAVAGLVGLLVGQPEKPDFDIEGECVDVTDQLKVANDAPSSGLPVLVVPLPPLRG